MQLTKYNLVELRSNRINLDLSDYLFRKTIRQQVASQLGPNPTRLQVKELLRIDLPYRRSVRALHVVCINLQLRFRVNARLIRQQEVFIRLHCIGLLRAFADEYLPIEDRPAVAIENSLVELTTVAMRLFVIDYRMRVCVLVRVDHVK